MVLSKTVKYRRIMSNTESHKNWRRKKIVRDFDKFTEKFLKVVNFFYFFEDFLRLKAVGFPLSLSYSRRIDKENHEIVKGSKENQSLVENSLSTATLATSLVKFPSNKWFSHKKVPIRQKNGEFFMGTVTP